MFSSIEWSLRSGPTHSKANQYARLNFNLGFIIHIQLPFFRHKNYTFNFLLKLSNMNGTDNCLYLDLGSKRVYALLYKKSLIYNNPIQIYLKMQLYNVFNFHFKFSNMKSNLTTDLILQFPAPYWIGNRAHMITRLGLTWQFFQTADLLTFRVLMHFQCDFSPQNCSLRQPHGNFVIK